MNTSDLKIALFREIDKLSSKRLNELYDLLKNNAEDGSDFWQSLSEIQKKDIEKGMEDLENGDYKDFSKVLSNYRS